MLNIWQSGDHPCSMDILDAMCQGLTNNAGVLAGYPKMVTCKRTPLLEPYPLLSSRCGRGISAALTRGVEQTMRFLIDLDCFLRYCALAVWICNVSRGTQLWSLRSSLPHCCVQHLWRAGLLMDRQSWPGAAVRCSLRSFPAFPQFIVADVGWVYFILLSYIRICMYIYNYVVMESCLFFFVIYRWVHDDLHCTKYH